MRSEHPELSSPGIECIRMNSAAGKMLFPVPAHRHYFSEVLLVRQGFCLVTRRNIVHHLKPGETIYISPMTEHSVTSEDGNPVLFDVIKFSPTQLREIPAYLSDLRAASRDAEKYNLPIHMSAAETTSFFLDKIVEECILEAEQRRFVYDLRIRALIYMIITSLARFWRDWKELNDPDSISADRDPLMSVPSYIEQHIAEPLKVEDLADLCGMSYPWFAKRFREFYGISCKQFIEHLRIDKAELLLLYTELDLAEISRKTGYTDCSHMIKDFRRLKGLTPGQFRSDMRN